MKSLLIATILASITNATATLDHPDDRNAIRENANKYVDAFKRKDSEAIANY